MKWIDSYLAAMLKNCPLAKRTQHTQIEIGAYTVFKKMKLILNR